jgi:hypothetical protein
MLRRKSKWRSKNQRKRLSPASRAWGAQTRLIARAENAARAEARLAAELSEPAAVSTVSKKPLRFRVTVECLTDGERVQFTAAEGPHGLLVSPTLAGQKVAAILRHYRPA